MIITGATPADRLLSADALRAAIADQVVCHAGEEIRLTTSVGLAEFDLRTGLDVFCAADRALYLAKSAGRNRVVHESEFQVSSALSHEQDAAHRRAAAKASKLRPTG